MQKNTIFSGKGVLYMKRNPAEKRLQLIIGIIFLFALAFCTAEKAAAWKGTMKWSYDAQNSITGSPLAAEGKILIGDSEGRLLALDQKTGSLVWTFSAGSAINGKPAVNGQAVFAGTADGKFFSLNIHTGELLWQFSPPEINTPGGVWGSPAPGGDLVYFNSADGKVYAMDRAKGTPVWTFDTGRELRSSPTYSE
ncbi:MAG: hypothetical protein EOM17_12750, partial [Synergistales bacterium]|nr:hypothetical protein [Synergistales bacterium]